MAKKSKSSQTKMLGIVNLIFGTFGTLIAFLFTAITYSAASYSYTDLDISINQIAYMGYAAIVVLLIVSFVNVYFGIRNVLGKNRDKTGYMIVAIIILLVITPIAMQLIAPLLMLVTFNTPGEFVTQ